MAKPTQADAEAAVRVLIEWAGDDPNREGLNRSVVAAQDGDFLAGRGVPQPRGLVP
jgi:hypothetical protein